MSIIRMLLALLAITTACIAHAQPATPSPSQMQVNINTADAETIASVLSGVGLKKAQAIIAHREQHGRFDAPADLTKVKGIGEATVARNAAKIVVSNGGSGNSPGKADEPG